MNELETTIEGLRGKERYDACIKRLFTHKRLIAPILKYAVPEYQNMDIEDIQNSISLYEFKKSDVYGKSDENEIYDSLNVIIIRRGKDFFENPNLLKYLDAVFNSKVDILDKYANIKPDENVERSVYSMPFEGTADAIINMKIQEAYDDGEENAAIEHTKAIMKSFNVDVEKAMVALNLDDDLKAKCLEYFKKNG